MGKMTDASPASPNANPPRVYINVPKKDFSEIKGLKLGDNVKVSIIGKLTELSQRDDAETGREGSITVEGYKLAISETANSIGELADEEDEA